MKDLPEGVEVSFVEVVERHPPKGAEPIHWLLLTTHPVATAADAWRIVSWYKQRWIIEQLFRSLKNQGLRIEDSQLDSAEGLIKLVAIATKVACVVIQLVQARNGGEQLPAEFAFTPEEIEALKAINKTLKGRTELQKNHHRPNTLGLGGMDHRQSSADGPATPLIAHLDQSPSTWEWLASNSSFMGRKTCRCPSANDRYAAAYWIPAFAGMTPM